MLSMPFGDLMRMRSATRYCAAIRQSKSASTASTSNPPAVKRTEITKLLEAGATHPATDYIPPDQSFHVLAKTKIIGPKETDTVTFTAPQVPGPYDYICTFPGHYASGMKGVMTVVP